MNALLSITFVCLLLDVTSLPMMRSLGPSLSLSAYWKQYRCSDGLGMRLQPSQWSEVLASFPVSLAPECKYVAGIPPLHNSNVRVPEPGNEAAEVHWVCMFICMCDMGSPRWLGYKAHVLVFHHLHVPTECLHWILYIVVWSAMYIQPVYREEKH